MSEQAFPAFSLRIVQQREAAGRSLRELARKAGIAPTTVMRAEQGNSISLPNALKIADALGVPIGDLLVPVRCAACMDRPPQGFTCNGCGQVAP